MKERKLKFKEICLYCKSYDMGKRECKGKPCSPDDKPEDRKCRYFRQSDDAKFCFAEGNKGINDKLPNAWSDYKRNELQKMYRKVLEGA